MEQVYMEQLGDLDEVYMEQLPPGFVA